MAKRNTTGKSGHETTETATPASAPAAGGDLMEQRIVAFAEQLGRVIGTVQAKTEGLVDRDALAQQLAQIRDGAGQLLQQLTPSVLGGGASQGSTAGAAQKKRAPAAANRGRQQASTNGRGRSGGVVDAPGKKHRKPVPNDVRANAADTTRISKMKAANARNRRGR